MICKFCATGADMQSRAKEIETMGELPEALIRYGKQLHGKCTDCDCAHKEVV